MQYSNLGMNQRISSTGPRIRGGEKKRTSFRDLCRKFFLMVVVAGVIWGGVSIASIGRVSAYGTLPDIKSALSGYCLDDHGGSMKPGSTVYYSLCNGSEAQAWSLSGGTIEKQGQYCLSAFKFEILIENCKKGSINQAWVRYGVGIKNISEQYCLSMPTQKNNQTLTLKPCNTTNIDESWTPSLWSGQSIFSMSSANCNQTDLGKRVACFAERQWLSWQTEPSLHNVLLTDYTDGNSNEEWCADFVSYVYRQAGDSFTNGERSGWDEYNANNIRYQGFTYHAANSGYIPRPGDVAYFNYLGGHVEIVVTGGAHPTFIYGDSGTIDPQTGNGDMAENQITGVAGEGQLEYYLSPS